MDRRCSRREFLQVGGLIAVLPLSGCTLFQADGIVLGDILVRNGYENRHRVRVELSRERELLLEETVVVDAKETEQLEATWPPTPGKYSLRYAVSGPDVNLDIEAKTITAADKYDPNQTCAIPAITLLPNKPPYVAVGNAARMGVSCSKTESSSS